MILTESIKILYNAFLNGASICTDSRAVVDSCIFFALKGPNFNGNQFAINALENGAQWAVVNENIIGHENKLIRVPDVLECLQQLALFHRKQLNIPVIAITGSNGKTTTKELVHIVLSKKYNTLSTLGNLNNHIGVPLTLLSIKHEHQVAVIEMGANHIKEIERLCTLSLPDYVLVTNVGKAHLEGFGDFDGVKKGKGEMFDYAKKNNSLVFIHDDNKILIEMLGEYKKCVLYGSGNHCDVQGKLISYNPYVQMEWKTKIDKGWNLIESKITGNYNFENILAAIAIGNHFKVENHDITSAIESYLPGNQRSQVIIKGTNCIIMDAYNANPSSMETALKNFNENFKTNRAVFLGDMLELGDASIIEHRNIISALKRYAFDLVILVGENLKSSANGFDAQYFDTSEEAMHWLKTQQLKNYNILIKGSRGCMMEKLMEGL